MDWLTPLVYHGNQVSKVKFSSQVDKACYSESEILTFHSSSYLVDFSNFAFQYSIEVKQLMLEPSDKFIVIASDGVWEFLSNETIARVVWPYYVKNSPEQAGNAIVRAAAQKWKENDTVIDDITCITIFLEVE